MSKEWVESFNQDWMQPEIKPGLLCDGSGSSLSFSHFSLQIFSYCANLGIEIG